MSQLLSRIGRGRAGAGLVALLVAGATALLPLAAFAQVAPSPPDQVHFQLAPNPKFASCLAQFPGNPQLPPTADVYVTRGELNDRMTVVLKFVKPNLAFDLFTVQRSSLQANGTPDPAFKGSFGLAWYQSDLQANGAGAGVAIIDTILLDQIFGFDPDANLPPTNTFHVGFWFNNPQDAAACGFDPSKPTPFNGEHRAGPLAMISVPDADTGLGPLCANPDRSTTPATCNP